jgi:hypothetical protein
MRYRKLGGVLLALAVIAAAAVAPASAGSKNPPVINDSQLHASFTTVGGGATVLPTQRTIPHWYGTTTDPENGVTYGYNMAGADPNSCKGSDCSVTIQADITPIVVNVGGMTFDGNQVLAPTLASPQFATNDYGRTKAATAAGSFPGLPAFVRGPGGALSRDDAHLPLQLEDATMRAQFGKAGKTSDYHLILQPHVLPAVTIDVPQNQGTLLQSGRGVVFADINLSWWSSQINNLEQSADPTHLPVYLTNNVMLYEGQSIYNCCVIGYHGTRAAGSGGGNAGGPLLPTGRRHRLGAAGHPRTEPRDRRVGGRPVREQLGRPLGDADGAAVRVHEHPRDRRPGRGDRLRDGHEHVRAGAEPERDAERRRLLPPRGRGVPAVVHAAAAGRHRQRAEPVRLRGPLQLHGRPQPVPGLPSAGDRLLAGSEHRTAEGAGRPAPSACLGS